MRPPAATAVAVLLLCVTSLAAYPADAPAAAGDTPRPALAPAPASGLDRPAEWQGAGAPPGAAPPGSAPDKPASAALSGFASRARRVRKLRKTTTPPDVLEGAESGAVVVGRTAVNAAATTVTANASTVAPATATPATSEAATTVAVPSTTASPSPTTTASSAPPSPTTLRAKTTSTTAAPAASSTTTDSTSTTVTAASSAVPYRGRGKFRLTTTSTEVPDVEHVERDAAGAVVMTDALYNHFRPLQREVPDNDHLTSFHEFGRKITSDPTRSPVAAGSPGTNLIVESTTWGRSVLRRVSPASSSAAPVDRKGRKTEEETHEEMDVGFDRQVVEKNKLATRRRDSARTIENLVILGSGGAGSTPTSVKKAARRKFVVTRKALLSNATDAPANVTHLEPVASVWSTTLPPPRPAPTTELLSTSSTIAPQTELSAPSGGDADSLETTPPPSAAPRRTLEMTSSKEAMLSKAQQRGRTAQLDVHRMVQELREVQEPVQQSSAPALQSARPDVPAVPAEARPTSEPPLHRAQDIAKVAAPSGAPSPAPSAAPGPAADNATDAYVLRRFEEPSGGTPPTELGFIKPPKSQIPYAFVVGRSSSADDVEVMQPLVGPRLAPVAYAEPPRRPEVVEAVVTSVSVKQPSPPATSAAPAAPATPGPAEEQVSLASPVSTENLQDVIKIFFNNTAPPTPEPPVTEVPPPVLPLAVEEKPVVTVVTNTSEVSVVLPTSTPPPSPTPSPRPLRYRSTTTTLAPTPTRVRSTTSPQDAATPPTSAPPASATTSTTTSAPPAATARAEVATPTPSTPLSSTPASSTPASPSTTPPSPTPAPTTPASEAESPTPFIIHVLPSEGTAVEAKPRAIWRDTTPTSTTTSTTTTSTTSTTTSTTTPAPTPPPAPSTEPPTAPSSTTTTTTTTTAPPPVEVEEEVIVASAAPKLDSQPPAPPHSDPPLPVEEEVAVASAAPKLDSQPPAPPRSNPPVPVSAESIRLRSNKQRPIPVPKEVFKTMTTVAPSASAAPAADGEGGEMTVPPATSTTTEAPKAVFQQPRPNITPVQKGQLGRGQAGAGGRGRGQAQDGAPSDADPLLLSAKGRGRAVSKQDFALMDQDAKRVPTERELGVVPPGVGVLTYVLLALGVVPLALASVCTARYFINRRKKVLDESDSSSELSCHRRARVGRPDVAATAKLPRPLPHLPTPPTPPKAWEDSDLEREKRDQREQRDQQRDREWDRDRVLQMPAPTRWEFPRDKLRLQTLLGQGNFGQVWKAEADDISGHHGLTRLVAVKTVKEGASVREREDLLQELGIMQQLGAHPNVVTLLGCCTEKEPFLLIMEYVMYGKLLAFLRDHRTRQDYYNFSEDSDALTSRDLTVFAFCVARGMEYLASKGVIHRDLAARNVLVDHNKLCKIADFGMSRSVRDSSCGQVYEQRENKGALPIRWMAPESLIYSVFTHKSDVWSFGILMWEIVTLGSTPYPTMGAREVLRRVRDGYRLERPAHCRPELFRIVLRCWHADPAKRPDFAELRRALADLLEDGVRAGSYVDLEGFAMDSKAGNAAGGGVCREDGRGGGGSSAPVLLNPLGNALRDEANV